MASYEKRITPDARLSLLAETVGKCDAFADVGCDHGRLGAVLLQRGWVQRAVLSDISADSLLKARKLIRLLGYEDRTRFCVCDGIPDDCPKTVVIAGMGGKLIAEMLARDVQKLGGARLILQANVANTQLRRALMQIGYRIQREKCVRDGRRIYVVIEAVPGEVHYTDKELLLGPLLMREREALYADYARFRWNVAQKALKGALAGGDAAEAEALQKEAECWQEVL